MILKVDFEGQIKVCQLKGVVRAEGQISGQKEYPVQRHKDMGARGKRNVLSWQLGRPLHHLLK